MSFDVAEAMRNDMFAHSITLSLRRVHRGLHVEGSFKTSTEREEFYGILFDIDKLLRGRGMHSTASTAMNYCSQ